MTVFDKIRATTSFGVVEVADSLYVDGRAYTKSSLTEILGLKLPLSNPYLFTGEESVNEAAGNQHYNNPQMCLPRSSFVGNSTTVVPSGDSTLSLCGKSYGSVNLAYDSSGRYFYQIVKSKGSSATAKSSLIRFSKNPAEPIVKSWELSRDSTAGTTSGSMDMYKPDYGTMDVFIKGTSDDLYLSLYTSLALQEKPNTGTYANSGLNAFNPTSVGPTNLWIDAFATSSACAANSVTADTRGNVYALAHTTISGSGSELVLTKLDAYGVLVWQKSFGGTTNEYGYAIHADKDDNIYVAGATTTGASGTTQALLAKVSASGTLVWQTSYGSALSDVGASITSDSSGNVYLAGTALSSYSETDTATGQLFVFKATSAGAITWQKTLSTATAQSSRSVSVDSSGNVYVAGYVDRLKNGSQAGYVLKLSSSGTYVWDKYLTGVAASAFYGSAIDSSGNLYVVGKTAPAIELVTEAGDVLTTEAGDAFVGETASKADLLAVKISPTGDIVWKTAIKDSTRSAVGLSATIDAQGSLCLAASLGSTSVYIAKINAAGAVHWQNAVSSNQTDRTGAIALAPSGELLVSFSRTTSPSFFVAKLPADGTKTGTYGSFLYQAQALTTETPDALLSSITETAAASALASFLSVSAISQTLGTASFTLTQTEVKAAVAGGLVQSIERGTGWIQATYVDPANQNPWAIFAKSQLYHTDSAGTPVFAVNRATGAKVSLGNLHSSNSDLVGCFVSNGEKMDDSGIIDDVVFYGVKMSSAGLEVKCATVDATGGTPTMLTESCTLSNTANVAGFDAVADTANPPEGRRVRPFLMKQNGIFYVGVAVYDVTAKQRTTNPYKMYVFKVTNKTQLALESTLDISADGTPILAMPMTDSQKKWLVAYSNKIIVYRWKAGSGFSKSEETTCANLTWVGVDSRQRIWFTDNGLTSEAGKQVSYHQTQSAQSLGAKASFALEFDAQRYVYAGKEITAYLSIRYYLPTGEQAEQFIVVAVYSDNARLQANETTVTAVTSATEEIKVPVTIRGPGYIDISVMSTS